MNGPWRYSRKEAVYDENIINSKMLNDFNYKTRFKNIVVNLVEYSKDRNTKKTYEEKKYITDTFILPIFSKLKVNDINTCK